MIRCVNCDGVDMQLIDSNGASYPDTRWELFECADCGHEQRTVLTA